MKRIELACRVLALMLIAAGCNDGGPEKNSAVVRMVRTGDGTWAVYKPDATKLDISNSATDGLQEAMEYAITNNHPLYVLGGGRDSKDYSVIHCDQTLVIRPLDMKSIYMESVTINFAGSMGPEPGVRFDSCMMADFRLRGQIVYAGTGSALEFKPTNPTPQDNIVTIVDSTFEFGAIYGGADADPLIKFDTTNGSIANGNTFAFQEINAGRTQIYIPTTTNSFSHNRILCAHIHGSEKAAKTCVRIGDNPTADIFGNYWNLQIDTADGQRGIDIYSKADLFLMSVWSSRGNPSPNQAIVFEDSAARNQLFLQRWMGGLTNNAAAQTNKIYYCDAKTDVPIRVGPSPYSYQNTDCRTQEVIVTGGSVSQIDISHDGSIWYDTTLDKGGTFTLEPGMYLRITYSALPTMRKLM